MSMQVRLTKLAPVICLLASQQCGELAAFAIVPPLGVHQTMTEEALTESNFQFTLPNGEQVRFSDEAIDPIKLENKAIDDMSEYIPKYHEEWHFDQERFSEGQGHLLRTRDLIILYLKDEAFRKSDPESLVKQEFLTKRSRSLVGNALHPLQDFYSHTNWVERHLARGFSEENIPINFALGAKGEPLPGGTDEACDVSTRGTIPLTSGDYFAAGVRDCSKLCTARNNKCAHGNVWPTYGLAESFCQGEEIPPNLHCGMNKDHNFRAYHEPAYEVAKKHTAIFVTEIFKEALSTSGANKSFVALAICQFMGVPNPMSTCVTTHTVTVQKLNKANGQPTLRGLVQSSGENITPAIDCGFLCEGTSIAGSTVVLTAKDKGGWKFVRWSEGGACAGSTAPKCSFTVTGDLLARPEFTEETQFVDWTSIDINSRIVSGTLGSTAVTFSWTAEGTVAATWFNEDLSWFSGDAFTPKVDWTDGLEFSGKKLPEPTPTYTITFAEPVTNPFLHIASLASTLTFIGAAPSLVSGDERLSVVGSQVIGTDLNGQTPNDANGTVMFPGSFSSLTFTAQYSGPGPIDGISLQVGTP